MSNESCSTHLPTISQTGLLDLSDYAVFAKNIVKCYGDGQPTLKNFGMTVKKGTIYGLLGSSGCGKTTILSCIVGLQRWESGDLLVLRQSPGKQLARRIGYMPQDLSLYDQLSIFEIIQFYGKLYNLSRTCMQERWRFLKTLLQLPQELKLIKQLSGGQCRRASLALALIHSPELLILDEPTVGLDPLLREKIWNYLKTIVKSQNTTIIVTTHYMEEARFCDIIGVMRNGQLIAESTPANLLEEFNCEHLDDAVMNLCRKNEKEPQKYDKLAAQNSSRTLCFEKLTPKCNFLDICQRFQNVFGLTVVTMLTFIRHPAYEKFLAILLLMPTIQCCLAIATLGRRVKDIHFGVVIHDLASWKSKCALQKALGTSCDLTSISCQFINKIQEDDLLILDDYENDEIALQQVQMGRTWGYFSIPANYSAHILELATQRIYASNETFEGSRIRLHVDHSQFFTAFLVVKNLYKSFLNYSAQLESCGLSKHDLELPYKFRPAVYGDYSDNYTPFVFPGVLLISTGLLTVILSATIFVSDYKQGTLSRARVAGLNFTDILLSHLVVQTIITLVQTGVLTGGLYFAFGISIQGAESQIHYVLFCFLTGMIAAPFGLLLGIACRDEVTVFIVGMLLVPMFIFYGGVLFPTKTALWIYQQVGYVIPLKVPIAALRSVLVRGLGITHPLVWSGYVASVAWILFFIVASVVSFRALNL